MEKMNLSIGEICTYIEILKEKLNAIKNAQTGLKSSLEEAKLKIDQDFENILFSLQARRTQLQRQVDVFTTHQMSVLIHQQAQLHYAYKSLGKVLKLIEHGNHAQDETLLREIIEEETKGIKKTTVWDSEVNVYLNKDILKSAISEWGKVSVNKIWTAPGSEIATYLPEIPEEYDDSAQLFFKSVLSEKDEIKLHFTKVWNDHASSWLIQENSSQQKDNYKQNSETKKSSTSESIVALSFDGSDLNGNSNIIESGAACDFLNLTLRDEAVADFVKHSQMKNEIYQDYFKIKDQVSAESTKKMKDDTEIKDALSEAFKQLMLKPWPKAENLNSSSEITGKDLCENPTEVSSFTDLIKLSFNTYFYEKDMNKWLSK